MILTEKEAKTKLCPFMSRQFSGPYMNAAGYEITCRSSSCMKWNWMPGKSPEELEERRVWNSNPTDPVGYCGA